MARPRKDIDFEAFKKLCYMQCTLEEIAGFFDCCEDTIENWCKRELKQSFSEAHKKHGAGGKISIRRNQFDLSKKSAAMAIWLGKQYLGQRDVVDIEDSAALRAAKELLGGVDSAID